MSARTNQLKCQSFSATISFEQSNSQPKQCDEENDEQQQNVVDACSKQSSFILLSPDKLYNDKAGSLIHGLIDDDDEEDSNNEQTLSTTSHIESQLHFPFGGFNPFKPIKAVSSGSSSIEKQSNSNLMRNGDDSQQSLLKTMSNVNALTCVTSFLSNSEQSTTKKSHSLLSFEQHETASNQTTSQCYNLSAVDEFSTQLHAENSSISKLLSSVKNKIEKSKQENEKKFPYFNSTPMIALRQTASVESPADLSSFEPQKSGGEKFQSFLEHEEEREGENGDESSSMLCKDMRKFNLNETDDDHTACDHLNSNEMTNLVSRLLPS